MVASGGRAEQKGRKPVPTRTPGSTRPRKPVKIAKPEIRVQSDPARHPSGSDSVLPHTISSGSGVHPKSENGTRIIKKNPSFASSNYFPFLFISFAFFHLSFSQPAAPQLSFLTLFFSFLCLPSRSASRPTHHTTHHHRRQLLGFDDHPRKLWPLFDRQTERPTHGPRPPFDRQRPTGHDHRSFDRDPWARHRPLFDDDSLRYIYIDTQFYICI